MTAHASADLTTPAALAAQQVLRSLLDGSPLPVTLPEADYGPWAETVHALRSAHAQGGRDAAHRAFVAMSRQEPPWSPCWLAQSPPRSRPCGPWPNSTPPTSRRRALWSPT